jgi:proteic killer suppression protein
MMEITFRNKKLQRTCSEEKEANKAYGKKRARKLMQRLMELRAFENLSEVPHQPPLRRHELSGKLKGTYAINLDHPYRLLFVPYHDPLPELKGGGIDLGKVTLIQITSIVDYH